MLIEVSVQYNGGLLPDIVILLTLAYATSLGNPFDTMVEFLSLLYSQCSHLVLTFWLITGRFRYVQIFFKQQKHLLIVQKIGGFTNNCCNLTSHTFR